jgi:hypothetical protein
MRTGFTTCAVLASGLLLLSGCRTVPAPERHALFHVPTLRMVHPYINSNPADTQQMDNQQMGRATRENLARLRDAGVNAIYFHGDSMFDPGVERRNPAEPWWRDPAILARIEEVCLLCRDLGLKVYFLPYFGAGAYEYPHVRLDPARDAAGKHSEKLYAGRPAYTPSWFDPAYQSTIIERDRALARVVGMGLADGVLIEPEVYTDAGVLSERGQLDFADGAYERFLIDMHASEAGRAGYMRIPREKRQEQLATDGLLGNYAEWQMRDLRRFAARWAAALRAEAPRIQLGLYQPGPWSSWALRSLAQGMYDPSFGPLLILDASTYYAHPKQWALGFEGTLTDYEAFREQVLADWGVRAFVVNGLCPYLYDEKNPERMGVWKDASDPATIEAFLRESRRNGNGWWIWNESRDPERMLRHIRRSEKE